MSNRSPNMWDLLKDRLSVVEEWNSTIVHKPNLTFWDFSYGICHPIPQEGQKNKHKIHYHYSIIFKKVGISQNNRILYKISSSQVHLWKYNHKIRMPFDYHQWQKIHFVNSTIEILLQKFMIEDKNMKSYHPQANNTLESV